MPAHLKKLHDRENGFTLIELLIVVLIIGILAAVAIPVYLGIQAQATKSAVRADVNIEVKRAQVALTEGASLQSLDNQASPKVGSARETLTTAVASDQKSYTVTGIASTSSNPAARVNFTYAYDSVTGKFTESDSGSGQPAIISFTTASLPDASTTTNYSQAVSVSNSNSTGSNAFSATGLPTGMGINATTGVISGTPGTAGAYSVVVTVTNGTTSASKTYALQVNAVPTISTASLQNPTQGVAYSQALAATGTPNSGFTYALTTGSLPAGLTLATNGTISGTATATGSSTFSIAASNSAGQGPAKAFTVVVGSVPTIAGSTSSATTIWPALSKIGYLPSEQPVTTGYPAPVISATGLPSGVSIDSATGALSGTPATAGSYNVTLSATNSYGTGTQNVTMSVLTGNNYYTWYMDQHQQASAIGGGKIKVGGWVVESDSAHAGQYTSSGDVSKANLRIDIQIDSQTVYTGLTDVARSDVNNAFGGNIGNMHGYAVTLSTSTGNHTVTVIARDGDNYKIIDNFSVTVN